MDREILWDLESDGLLPTLTRIHCMVLRDYQTKETFRFRRNHEMDNIRDGIELLRSSRLTIGHNIIGFDIKALKKVYADFSLEPDQVCDTLVLVRQIPADFSRLDARLVKAGRLPAVLQGKHSLDSWGYRLGKHKGDYAKKMLAQGLDPWKAWNQEMEDYCENDVDVTEALWDYVGGQELSPDAVDMEHALQEIVSDMEQEGFPFNKAEAEKLAETLQQDCDQLIASVSENVCGRYVPEKKYVVKPIWDDPDGINKKKPYKSPRTEYGEDTSRAVWADISIPKRTSRTSDPTKRGSKTEGAPYCRIKWQEFSPTSRPQLRDHLVEVYNWNPVDWTDKGNPALDDSVLRGLADVVPYAESLADIFFLQKLLGYLSSGPGSWIKNCSDDGKVHPYTNTGGCVTGRCSHAGPNIAQVPGVKIFEDKAVGTKEVLLGRAGNYGHECRSLFYVPKIVNGEKWKQVGVDLSGIEFRCLAELVAEFDGGELIDVVLNGDIHAYNMEKTGIPKRDVVKRVLYGLLYGAGDAKLGAIVDPLASLSEQMRLGAAIRAQLMAGLPALDAAIKKIKKQANKGYIYGLDGRKILVRSDHSALNTKLQSDAALIAKRWVVFTYDSCVERGMKFGWDGDFSLLAFVHDELQAGTREDFAQDYADICVQAAADAGLSFNFKCPVEAKPQFGHNWADCH